MTRTALILPLLTSTLFSAASDQKGVEFAKLGGHPLLLDLHVPDGPGPFPAAILVHGGGFDGGSRERNMAPTFQPLADANFPWFSIDYRMAPDFRYRDAIADMDAALKWLKANAETYKVDTRRIVISGESAGGYLVNYAAAHETPETKVAAVVDFYGPVDYEKIARQRHDYPARFNMASIDGHQSTHGGIWFFEVDGYDDAAYAKLKEVSPVLALHKGMPPFLEIHGTRDDQVPYEQSTIMCDALHKLGGVCDVVTIEAGGHGMSGWKDVDQQHYKTEMIAEAKGHSILTGCLLCARPPIRPSRNTPRNPNERRGGRSRVTPEQLLGFLPTRGIERPPHEAWYLRLRLNYEFDVIQKLQLMKPNLGRWRST